MIQSIFAVGKSHFEDDGTQNYLVFQITCRYFNTVSNNDSNILSWKSKGLFDESIKPPSTSNIMLNPSVNYVYTKARLEFKGDCLKQDKISFYHGKTVNIYIVYEINGNVNISSCQTLENSQQNILILISINILDMVLEFIEKDFFQWVKKFGEM